MALSENTTRIISIIIAGALAIVIIIAEFKPEARGYVGDLLKGILPFFNGLVQIK